MSSKYRDVKKEYKGAPENFLEVRVHAPWLVPKFRTEFRADA